MFGNIAERRENKCCAVLMKYRRKVKGEQVITPQMAQQLKTKNINVVPGQLFCRQCKAKFFRDRRTVFRDRRTVLMIKINFDLLQILKMNSLNVKHQRKSSNQLAFHLPAYTHLRKL